MSSQMPELLERLTIDGIKVGRIGNKTPIDKTLLIRTLTSLLK